MINSGLILKVKTFAILTNPFKKKRMPFSLENKADVRTKSSYSPPGLGQ